MGADGVGSTVRQALGMPFPGRSAVRSVMLADVKLADAPTDTLTVNAAGDAFGFLAVSPNDMPGRGPIRDSFQVVRPEVDLYRRVP